MKLTLVRLALAVGLAGCGGGAAAAAPTATPSNCGGCAAARAQGRLDALTGVARRIYTIETSGGAARRAVERLARDRVLLAAIRAGDAKAALAEGDRQLVGHVVRIRIYRGGRLLADANPTSFAVGGRSIAVPGGRVEATIQDVIGFAKLTHRESGAGIVVRGRGGHVAASPPALGRRRPPPAGAMTFRETGFAGEPLTVWVLP